VSERQQNIAPRAKKPAARPKRGTPVASNRRKADPRRWLRVVLIGMAILAPVAAVAVIARSEAFALRRVDIVGAKRTSAEKIEQLVRKAGGEAGIFSFDLDAIRRSVETERYVRTAAVVRVLPDTILVRIEEREPAIVARLASGRLVWVDNEAHVLDEYRAERGAAVPPPLAGFDDGDASDRVTAENRDRIAAYEKIHEALTPDDLWNRIDEVDLRFIKDASVQLADNAIVVRLGEGEYHPRLTRALVLLEAARRGDTETLARYRVPDVVTLLASADSINQIDMTRANGSVTFSFSKRRNTADGAAPAAGAPVTAAPTAPVGTPAAGKPESKPATKPESGPESKPKPATTTEPKPKPVEPGTEQRRRTVTKPTASLLEPRDARTETRRT
jgi:hypothetical protein